MTLKQLAGNQPHQKGANNKKRSWNQKKLKQYL